MPGYRCQGTGARVQVPGYRCQGTGARVQVPGYRFQGTGARVQVPGYRFQATGARVQVPGYRFQGTGARVQVPGYRFQGTGARVQVPGYRCQGTGAILKLGCRVSAILISGSCFTYYMYLVMTERFLFFSPVDFFSKAVTSSNATYYQCPSSQYHTLLPNITLRYPIQLKEDECLSQVEQEASVGGFTVGTTLKFYNTIPFFEE